MIYLVRHGQTDWNMEKRMQGQIDIPLNDNGREQARAVSESISKLKIDKIISSDLKRAKETAEIINEKIGAEISFDSRLREINFGDLEGVSREEIMPETWAIFETTPEKLNAEPIDEVHKRIKGFFDELGKYDGNVLVVSHGGALRMAMYYEKNRNGFDNEEYTKNYRRMDINNADLFELNI